MLLPMIVGAAFAVFGALVGSPGWAAVFGAVVGAVIVSAGALAEAKQDGKP